MESRPVVEGLKCWERWACGILGLLCLVGAGILLYRPPMAKQFPPQCASGECAAVMPTVPMAVIVALLGVAALFIVVALNGKRLLSVKVAGVEAQMAGASESAKRALAGKDVEDTKGAGAGKPADTAPEGTTPASQPAQTITIGNIEYELFSLEDVPTRVMKDALEGIAKPAPNGAGDVPPGTLGRLEFIARKSGRGNHPWLLKFRDLDQTWKVSYGGQGKGEATVAPLT